MELWDAYDSSFTRIEGKTLVRGEDIPDGMFHLVTSILVRHTDGSYLLMKRDPRKHYGGIWEASAGGSALVGETALMCAVRELREESGIDAAPNALTELKTLIKHEHGIIYVHFMCVTDCEKDDITLQAGETTDYMWVKRSTLLEMLGNGTAVPSIVSHFLEAER